jgi:hypothetical protein
MHGLWQRWRRLLRRPLGVPAPSGSRCGSTAMSGRLGRWTAWAGPDRIILIHLVVHSFHPAIVPSRIPGRIYLMMTPTSSGASVT